MDVLIIGGGIFLGAALVDAGIARSHRLTVFNRGQSRAEWPPGVEALVGDRSSGLEGLEGLAGRRFDAVIDTCGYIAPDVRASAEALHASGCYCFVSSISAYASFAHAPIVESDALASCAHAVDEALLLAAGVAPWSELPLWLPSGDPEHRGHSRVDLTRSIAAGLATRPLAETIAAVLDEGLPAADDPRRRGQLTPERETELLARVRVAPAHGVAA